MHRENGMSAPENPLLSVITCTALRSCSFGNSKFTTDFYMIAMKKIKSGLFLYGKTKYDHDNGSMSFVKPRQIIEIADIELTETGFVIFVHEDFLLGHHLHEEIKKYGFFDYETNEALHLSPKEEETIWELFRKIDAENNNNPDEFSKEIILTHIDSILKYSNRFYRRQFINRKTISGTTVSKFIDTLSSYFKSGLLHTQGLPTVKHLASKLNTSSRYLSDILKQETGKTALEHIHIFLIDEAKNLLISTDKSISETAYELGFENLPYFSRLFKKEVGMSPNKYRDRFVN